MMRPIFRVLSGFYAIAIYAFIFLPVAVLVLFSFQGSIIPVPPFNGPSLHWYQAALADPRLMNGLFNSLVVAAVSSAVSVLLGFLAAYGLARFRVVAAGLVKGLISAPLRGRAMQPHGFHGSDIIGKFFGRTAGH